MGERTLFGYYDNTGTSKLIKYRIDVNYVSSPKTCIIVYVGGGGGN
jgi:hypothetical protein